ncbi:Thioredoxin reductase [Lachnellula hyalina]|uniref:Thioredoxin reductase n=1 Tax=Lachnellula hyalina TaxID=1316788 RepID=A0A8H8QUU2_9HELO|nr:Thioredoxin reductase [Lachnellula hyalina]TVY22565.1 Thioredoxin reductase [Lachnellula hyalina]
MAPSSYNGFYTYALAGLVVLSTLYWNQYHAPEIVSHDFGAQLESPVDVIILGGSHAGLSAAATLYRHQLSTLIFDHQKPRNSWLTPMRVLSGWEGKNPDALREKSRKEIAATGFAKTLDKTIISVEKTNNTLFLVTDSEGGMWYGRKLLLAMGAEFVFPEIPGYAENFPKKIFHCMFTFGFEKRGSEHAGLLAKGSLSTVKHALMVAQDTLKFAKNLSIYTDSNPTLAADLLSALASNSLSDSVDINDHSIKRLSSGGASTISLSLGDETTHTRDFLVHQPLARPPPWIVQQLGLELDVMGNIKTNGFFYQTNVEGVFAAGDCASPFKIIPNALLMGANAAAGVARELPRSVTGNGLRGFEGRERRGIWMRIAGLGGF